MGSILTKDYAYWRARVELYPHRVREIDEAFGEVVAYLEFELSNHPQIDDCSAFL